MRRSATRTSFETNFRGLKPTTIVGTRSASNNPARVPARRADPNPGLQRTRWRLQLDAIFLLFLLSLFLPMKIPRLSLTLLLGLAAFATTAAVSRAAASADRVYELRTYTAAPGKMEALLARFRDHTTKLFEKHGMKNIGYWTPLEAKDGAADKLVYLLEHKSEEAAKASWKTFSADSAWQAVQKKSAESGKLVATLESVYLTPTDYSKSMDAGKSGGGRVFELRTYTTPEGKLRDLDARFRDHTMALFAKHGMSNLAYFHPVASDKRAANTLIYFLAHPSREAGAASFRAFAKDPEWMKARDASEKNGKLTAKVESLFLTPTDFSKLK